MWCAHRSWWKVGDFFFATAAGRFFWTSDHYCTWWRFFIFHFMIFHDFWIFFYQLVCWMSMSYSSGRCPFVAAMRSDCSPKTGAQKESKNVLQKLQDLGLLDVFGCLFFSVFWGIGQLLLVLLCCSIVLAKFSPNDQPIPTSFRWVVLLRCGGMDGEMAELMCIL